MSPHRQVLAVLLALSLMVVCGESIGSAAEKEKAGKAPRPVTILISIDGFRPSYLRRGNSPTLDALADTGFVGSLEPGFPSVTFPNHYAMVTGLWPDHHGVVANAMVDPRRPDVTFTLADQALLDDPFWWDEAEPIWVTAEKQGIRTATMFWPGSTATIHGVRPSDSRRYDKTMPSSDRAAAVLEWLRRPVETRPRFITLYFDEVDSAGHSFGPGAPETAAAIANVDRAIGTVHDGLTQLGIAANLVIVSDHGMAEISPDRYFDLDRLVPRGDYRIVYGGPFTAIAPMPGKEESVTKALAGQRGKMTCWPKAQVPERFRYGKNPRVAPIVCLADFGWQISQGPPIHADRGGHGFDPGAPEMAGLFMANGPAFRGAPHALGKAMTVGVYRLLARLIGIEPLPNDGNPQGLVTIAAP